MKNKNRVIVIEDEKNSATILQLILKNLGFETLEFENGDLAYRYLSSLSEDEVQSIFAIFSDIMMPQMDGLELTYKLRELEFFESIPIALVTGMESGILGSEDIREVISHYINKPITREKVELAVQEMQDIHVQES